jgi:DNA repair protein RAD50
VRDKRARQLQECAENIEQFQAKVSSHSALIENTRAVIAKIEKEINQSGAYVANLRENIRMKKMIREIAEIQTKIESHDMEEAAKSRRIFQDRYHVEKQKETEMQAKVLLRCCLNLLD